MLESLEKISCWFDPFLMIYNTLMLIAAIMVPLFIAWSYVRTMGEEKKRRLTTALAGLPAAHASDIGERLDREFRLRNYLGGVVAAMVVTAFGAGIMLLMKPVPLNLDSSLLMPVEGQWCSGPTAFGVDFRKGASFLVLGTFIKDIGDAEAFYPNLVIALTAFQFGFLGAWIYFVTEAARSYFMCDLTPNTFVNGTIRMITASLLALVVSFMMPLFVPDTAQETWLPRALPVVSFFFGYFPSRALLAIENFVAAIPGLIGATPSRTTPLSSLSGVSYLHEVRLRREGIDNVENLADAGAVDLALRTGFGYRQLERWIDEAWLRVRLGDHADPFAEATGIMSRTDLVTAADRASDELALAIDGQPYAAKVEVLCRTATEPATAPPPPPVAPATATAAPVTQDPDSAEAPSDRGRPV